VSGIEKIGKQDIHVFTGKERIGDIEKVSRKVPAERHIHGIRRTGRFGNHHQLFDRLPGKRSQFKSRAAACGRRRGARPARMCLNDHPVSPGPGQRPQRQCIVEEFRERLRVKDAALPEDALSGKLFDQKPY